MPYFLSKRLKLIPLTLFLVLFLNFILVNLAKESLGGISKENLYSYLEKGGADLVDDDFSRSYGLRLPILLNTWPFISSKRVVRLIEQKDPKILLMAPYILEKLSTLYQKSTLLEEKEILSKLIVIGGLHSLTARHAFGKREIDAQTAHEIAHMESLLGASSSLKIEQLKFSNSSSFLKKVQTLLIETRLFRYFKKVCLLDFGTLRYDSSKKVLPFVVKRFGISLILLTLPLLLTFIFAQLLGLLIALKENQWVGVSLSLLFTALYAIPIYIMAPLLIEKVGIRFGLPIHGIDFKSISHFILPTLALLYGAVAIYSRIHKALFHRLLSQDYLLVAKAKGITKMRLLFVHTFREALITTTPLALGSIGFFMGGLIIVESLFEIEGFGAFFYQAILLHDYNVIIFSTLLISMMTMLGYLLADIALYKLDPRICHNADQRVFEKA